MRVNVSSASSDSPITRLSQNKEIDDAFNCVECAIENLTYILENAGHSIFNSDALHAVRHIREVLEHLEAHRNGIVDAYKVCGNSEGFPNIVYQLFLISRDLRNKIFLRTRNRKTSSESTDDLQAAKPLSDSFIVRRIKVLNRQLSAFEMFMGKSLVNSLPVFLTIEPTTFCNFSCVMCPQGIHSLKPAYVELNDRQIRSLLPVLESLHMLHCQIVGEPTLSTQLGKITSEAINCGVLVGMITNGSALHQTNAHIEQFHSIMFSFDGATKDTFEKQRSGGNFDIVVKNIRDACARCPDVIFQFNVVLSRLNCREICDIVRFAKDVGVRKINISTLNQDERPLLLKSSEHRHLGMMTFSRDEFSQVTKYVDEAMQLGQELGVVVQSRIESRDLPLVNACDSQDDLNLRLLNRELDEISSKGSNEGTHELVSELLAFDLSILTKMQASAAPIEVPVNDQYDTQLEAIFPDDIATTSFARQRALEQHVSAAFVEVERNRPSCFQMPYCGAPWQAGIVHASGSLVPCCYLGSTSMGSVEEEGFAPLWNGPKLSELRRKMITEEQLPGPCTNCNGGSRYIHLPDALNLASRLGYRWSEISWPSNFNPPQEHMDLIERFRVDQFLDSSNTYDFSDNFLAASDNAARRYFRYGFAPVVKGGAGRWTDGVEAIFDFRVIVPTQSLEFGICARAFVNPEKHPAQVVSISVNGHAIGKWQFEDRNSGERRIRIDRSVISAEGALKITLGLDSAIAPRDIGMGTPSGLRALFIESFVLRLFDSE